MGEDTHSPTVGLVVPVVGHAEVHREIAFIDAVKQAAEALVGGPPALEEDDGIAEYRLTVGTPIKRRAAPRNDTLDIGIAIQALQTARGHIDSADANTARHRKQEAVNMALSDLGLAKRSANEAIRRIDAAVKRLERGGE